MLVETTQELRLAVECASGRNLTEAAGLLQITPAAASAMLKRLERRVGTRLFERSTRAMRPTPAGETLAGYARRALELVEEGVALAGEERQALRGTIRVTAPSDLARHSLLGWIDLFLERNPGVEVVLQVSDAVRDVVRDRFDVALRYGTLEDSGLVARKLADARRVAVAAPAYLAARGQPVRPADLSDHDCITYHLGGGRSMRWRFYRPDGSLDSEVRVRGRRACDDAEIARRWALRGRGITYKSELDVREDLRRGDLVRLFPELLGEPVPLHAVLPSHRFVPARLRAFVEHVATCAAAGEGATQARGVGAAPPPGVSR